MSIITSPYSHDGLHVAQLFADLELAAYNSLAQTPTGLPACHGVSWDEPPEDTCDAFWLWIRDWTPVKVGEFPNAVTDSQVCQPVDMDPTVILTLRRPCAPKAGDTELATAFTQNMLADSRALFCGVFSTWPTLLDAAYTNCRIQYRPATAGGQGSECMSLNWEIFLELRGCRGAGCLDQP